MQPERHFFWDGDKLVGIEAAHINRSFAVASLLAFPAALAVYSGNGGARRAVLSALLVAGTLAAAMMSRHESSMVALVAGAVVFAIAWWSKSGPRVC